MKKILILLTFFLISIGILFSCGKTPTGSTVSVPEVFTSGVAHITDITVRCGGSVIFDGGAPVTARGVCWSTEQLPTVADDTTSDGTGVGSFTSYITGLTVDTIYYVRAYARNNVGTDYGNTISFTTKEKFVMDVDSNVYLTVQIGNQWWMAENLKVTHYRNGDPIPNVTDRTEWSNLTTGAYCYYDNNVSTYGRLYNCYAVTDSRNIAPEGWHVPPIEEWRTLIYYLGSYSVAGGKMKEAGTLHWESPNTGATNESGFTALPGGDRNSQTNFVGIGDRAFFWSCSEAAYDSTEILYIYLSNNATSVQTPSASKETGFSVRCIKD